MKVRKHSHLFSLSASDLKILREVGLLRFVRARDLAYRLSRPTSLTYYRRRLSALCGTEKDPPGFLSRIPEPSTKKGERAWIYSLSAKGAQTLFQEGAALSPYKLRHLSYGFLRHSLQLTSVLCSAHYFVRTHSLYTLSQEMLSYTLVRNPPTVTLQAEAHTKPVTVVPDAFLCFERDGTKFPVFLEIDRGTEHEKRFKENLLRHRIDFIRSGAYARYFQQKGVVLAYATIGDQPSRDTRRASMQQWALEIIDEMIVKEHRQAWRELFRFCSLPDSLYEHTNAIFGDAIWYSPGSDTAVPLFDRLPSTDEDETHVHGHSTLA
jgi:hypothetical protein